MIKVISTGIKNILTRQALSTIFFLFCSMVKGVICPPWRGADLPVKFSIFFSAFALHYRIIYIYVNSREG